MKSIASSFAMVGGVLSGWQLGSLVMGKELDSTMLVGAGIAITLWLVLSILRAAAD